MLHRFHLDFEPMKKYGQPPNQHGGGCHNIPMTNLVRIIRPITLIPASSKFAHLSLFALPTLIGYDITPLSAGFVALTRIGLMELAERGKGQIAG